MLLQLDSRAAMRLFFTAALFAALVLPAHAHASAGRTAIDLKLGVLRGLGIEVVGIHTTADTEDSEFLGFEIVSGSGLSYSGRYPNNEGFDGGWLQHRGGFSLLIDGLQLPLQGFTLLPSSDERYTFDLRDADGDVWFHVGNPHYVTSEDGSELVLQYGDLVVSERLANLVDIPTLAANPVGVVETKLPFSWLQARRQTNASEGLFESNEGDPCVPPGPGTRDIALTNLTQLGQANDSREVDGRVAVTIGAFLENVGESTIEWGRPILGFGVNNANIVFEHPFLSFSLYRLANGRLQQISTSGVKHTFFSINSGCVCSGDQFIFAGCGDAYDSNTNENRRWLAPRDEIDPNTGGWTILGSHFDAFDAISGMIDPLLANESRSHLDEGHDQFEHRMVTTEGDLEVSGASYWASAWYITRDDIDIFNSMGRIPFVPTLSGDTWTFSGTTPFTQGSVLDEFVDPAAPPAGTANTVVDTGEGELQVAVVSSDAGGGMTHYEYALMNHDYTRSVVSFEVPIPAGTVVTNLEYASPDSDPLNDWTASVEANAIRWDAPVGAELTWGHLVNFAFDADVASGATTLTVLGASSEIPVAVPVQAVPEAGGATLGAASVAVLAALRRRQRTLQVSRSAR